MSLYLQQVGRVLRPFEGKNDAIILDHVGNVMRHGLPNDEREWTLEGGAVKKKSTDADSVRQCEKCFASYYPAPQCPECGHRNAPRIREIEEEDGQLSEVKMEIIRQKKREIGRARTLEELQRIAAQRGYSKGWAYHVYNARRNRAVS